MNNIYLFIVNNTFYGRVTLIFFGAGDSEIVWDLFNDEYPDYYKAKLQKDVYVGVRCEYIGQKTDHEGLIKEIEV